MESVKPNLKQEIASLKELIHGIDAAMFTSINENGKLHSRPMVTQEVDENGDLWFFTSEDTAKVNEIRGHREVNLTYSLNEKHKFIALTGKAHIVRDHKKMQELWKPVQEKWFPKGLNDPHLVLLRVEVESVEYWENHISQSHTMAGLAQALLAGRIKTPSI